MSKRHLLVWFHALTSIGWMTLALCLATLLIFGRSHGDRSAVLMAQVLDKQLLQHLGTASAFTGFMLCALTPWGYFRYWWVLAKAVISGSQLYVRAFILRSRRKPPSAPGWLYLAAVAVPVIDYVLFKAPPLSLLVVLIYPLFRSRLPRQA